MSDDPLVELVVDDCPPPQAMDPASTAQAAEYRSDDNVMTPP
jgi:hypothetical protein